MKTVLNLSQEQRNTIFEVTAREMRVRPVIIEKDFWVCVILDYLLNKSKHKDALIFKGGTSLSKCYGVIKRFSEDVDLVLKWDVLGFNDKEVYQERSYTQCSKFEVEMNQKGAEFIHNEIKIDLIKNLSPLIHGITIESDDKDPMVLYVSYPHVGNDQYIKSAIKLEIGPVAAKTPTEKIVIRPYYNNYFKLEGDDTDFNVKTVSIARTFWEKILILYAETNRPAEKKMPARYFRHYYDVAMIYKSQYFERIVENLDLFEEVKFFKNKYYRTSWSKLDECKLSSISLVPNTDRLKELEKDYQSMKDMFFEGAPKFEDIICDLTNLESVLNSLL